MSRVKFYRGQQRYFLNRVAKYFDNDWSKVAKISNICERSLRDWRRERYNMSYESLLKFSRISTIPIPKVIEVLSEHWSLNKACRWGAINRNKLYGNPSTPAGRRKGRMTTSKKFRQDPEFAKAMALKLRKPIDTPAYSSKLAEFIGVMLGDGYIKSNKTQLGISLNMETDYAYALYVQNLINDLFKLNSSVCREISNKSVTVLISSRNLVEFLVDKGLKAGNKVINQVGIPKWVGLKEEYKIACLRGLIDTDGSFYAYLHRVNGKVYKNYALDFTNHSVSLLKDVKDILENLGFAPTSAKYKVLLHKKRDIKQYITIVGSSNPAIKDKFRNSKI